MSFTLITLTGKYNREDGTRASGAVTFTLSTPLIDGSTNEMRAPVPYKAVLDSTGAFSVALTATNDPTSSPAGVTYTVLEQIFGAAERTYSIEVAYNAAGGTLDLADVVPIAAGTPAALLPDTGFGFAAEPTTRWQRIANGIVTWTILGVERLRLSATELLVSAGLKVTGTTKIADGTAAAPALVPTSDTDSGLFVVEPDVLGLAMGGKEYRRIGAFTMPTDLPAQTVTLSDGGNKDPYWMSADGTKLYAGGTNTLYESIDDGVTWTTVHAGFSTSIVGVRDLANGELLVSIAATGGTPGFLSLSSGYPQWGGSAGNITWTTVLNAGAGGVGPSSYFPGLWGMSTYGAIVVVSEYGLQNPPTDSARFVYLSTDYGATWTQIFDLGTAASAHTHGVAYDPWWDAIWLVNGDGAANRQVRVSWNRGSTWNTFTGGDTTQYVGILPMRDCILFTTDGAVNGVHRIDRARGRENLQLVVACKINTSGAQTHVGGMPFLSPGTDGLAILPFITATAGLSGYVLTTYDGVRFMTPWADTHTYTVKGPLVLLGPTALGKIVGYQSDDRQANNSRISWVALQSPERTGIIAQRTTALNAALAALAPLGSNLTNGAFYSTTPGTGRAPATRANGNMYLVPIYISRPCIIDQIGVETTGSATVGGLIRLGIYNSDPVSGIPGTLLVDAGTVDATVAPAFLSASLSQKISAPGLYWLAGVVQGLPATPPTIRLLATSSAYAMPHATALSATGGGIVGYLHTGATGALPGTFVYGGTTGNPMCIAIRIKA